MQSQRFFCPTHFQNIPDMFSPFTIFFPFGDLGPLSSQLGLDLIKDLIVAYDTNKYRNEYRDYVKAYSYGPRIQFWGKATKPSKWFFQTYLLISPFCNIFVNDVNSKRQNIIVHVACKISVLPTGSKATKPGPSVSSIWHTARIWALQFPELTTCWPQPIAIRWVKAACNKLTKLFQRSRKIESWWHDRHVFFRLFFI